MVMKAAALLGLGGLAAWYVLVGGRQIDEEQARSMYREYIAAFDAADAKAFCKLHDKKIDGRNRYTSIRVMPVHEQVDQASACALVDEFHRRKAELEASTGEEMYTTLEMHIQSVKIASDKKSAQVELLFEARIGTEHKPLLDMRSQRSDTLTRWLGRASLRHSDAVISFYR